MKLGENTEYTIRTHTVHMGRAIIIRIIALHELTVYAYILYNKNIITFSD